MIISDHFIPERRAEFTDRQILDEMNAYNASQEMRIYIEKKIEAGEKVKPGITTIFMYCTGISDEKPVDQSAYMRFELAQLDIDIDFADVKRYIVEEYAAEKYGHENVARLGTVSLFKPRSILQTISGELKIPKWEADKALDSLINRSSGDARALNTLEDTLRNTDSGRSLIEKHPEVASVLEGFEGHPRHSGQHAAGIVISRNRIADTVAIDSRTGATMCDKKDAEELNLLKIDALGLTQLSIFEDTLALAGLPLDHLMKIPLDDQKAFEVLQRKQYCGIFQFNGMALQSLTNAVKIDCLEDIVAITALARPGPLGSGAATEWVKRRNDPTQITYWEESFKPHLETSLGVVIYQETVMNISREIGGLSWSDVTKLRQAMSKSLGQEYFDTFGDRWKAGAIERGVSPGKVNEIWNNLCTMGNWSFNRSHAVAYGIISYQCCWLKAHYPLEFAAATLQHANDPEFQIKLLREIVYEGNSYIPVDAKISTDKWVVGKKDGKSVLVGPLQNIKGIGPKSVTKILAARRSGEEIKGREKKLLEDPKTPLDSLFPITDRLKEILPDPSVKNIFTLPTPLMNVQVVMEGPDQEHLVYCVFSKLNPRDENEAVNAAKRGGKLITDGFTWSLNIQATDDTDTVFLKINRFKFKKLAPEIIERGGIGKHIYAVKGKVSSGFNFRMLQVEAVRYIGPMEDVKKD